MCLAIKVNINGCYTLMKKQLFWTLKMPNVYTKETAKIEYWCNLLKTDNYKLQACYYKQLYCEYEKQQGNCTNWASKIWN